MSASGSRRMRVLFFGTPCTFSLAPLAALTAGPHDVVAVVVPRNGRGGGALPVELKAPQVLPLSVPLVNPYQSYTIVQLAWQHSIPVWEVGRPDDPRILDLVATFQPDVAVVACFPRRIPPSILRQPVLGFLNIHPSVLPAYRGPAPLFWTFRDGSRSSGVTLHLMDEEFDSGPIIRQLPVQLDDGWTGREADERCGAVAGSIINSALEALGDGQRGYPQAGRPTSAPWPRPQDFVLQTSWSAQRAYNFMRGTAAWEHPFLVRCDNDELALCHALGYDAAAVLGAPVVQAGHLVRLQFTPGVLEAELVPASAPP